MKVEAKIEKRKWKMKNGDPGICDDSTPGGTGNYHSTPGAWNPAILQAALEKSWRLSAGAFGASNCYASTIEV
jgi:hypothetical protein